MPYAELYRSCTGLSLIFFALDQSPVSALIQPDIDPLPHARPRRPRLKAEQSSEPSAPEHKANRVREAVCGWPLVETLRSSVSVLRTLRLHLSFLPACSASCSLRLIRILRSSRTPTAAKLRSSLA